MPDIEISKIKARRGTNNQRKLVSLDQGELAYTLDTKRLYVGDGVNLGGNVVGSKVHYPLNNYYSLTALKAEIGDIVSLNNVYYQLLTTDPTNINNWKKIILNVDPVIFSFNSSDTLTINDGSIKASKLNPDTVTNGVHISNATLQLNLNTKSLEISSAQLSIKQSGIDEREISSTTLTNGLTGGSGEKIRVLVDPDNIYFDEQNRISLSGYNPFTLRFSDLNWLWFGSGLSYNPTLSVIKTILTDVNGDNTILKDGNGEIYFNTDIFGPGLEYDAMYPLLSSNIASTDEVSILRNEDGSIKINDNVTPSTKILSKTTVDTFGRVTSQNSSIVSALTGNNLANSNNSLSSIFNGCIISDVPGVNITTFTAISSNGATLSLSSAGFITFEGPSTTQEGQTIRRFAIPIFAY